MPFVPESKNTVNVLIYGDHEKFYTLQTGGGGTFTSSTSTRQHICPSVIQASRAFKYCLSAGYKQNKTKSSTNKNKDDVYSIERSDSVSCLL